MKITIELDAEYENRLIKATEQSIKDMENDGYDFDVWTPKLEATTLLRMALREKTK